MREHEVSEEVEFESYWDYILAVLENDCGFMYDQDSDIHYYLDPQFDTAVDKLSASDLSTMCCMTNIKPLSSLREVQ